MIGLPRNGTMTSYRTGIICLLALFFACPVFGLGGQLNDFEWDATKRHEESPSQAAQSDGCDEKDPRTSLTIMEYYILYRMSPGTRFEIDLGAGEIAVTGMQDNFGFSVTVPVLYHPSESFGVELRPAWSSINENPIQDMEIAVLAGMRYVSVKAGYRWMSSPHQSLDGPEIGLAIRW